MKKLIGIVFAAALASSAASADVLYDGGAINGQTDGWTLNFGFQVGNTFSLGNDSTVTGVENMGLWLFQGDNATSIDWAITSDPTGAGTTYGSGTAALTLTPVLTPNNLGYNVYAASFSIGALALNAGNYWLVLQNLVVDTGDPGYWDMNGGPSQAWESDIGFDPRDGGGCDEAAFNECSDSFQIVGRTGGTVPEPATLALVGAGLAGMSRLRRKKN